MQMGAGDNSDSEQELSADEANDDASVGLLPCLHCSGNDTTVRLKPVLGMPALCLAWL